MPDAQPIHLGVINVLGKRQRYLGDGALAKLGPPKSAAFDFALRFALESGLSNSGTDTDSDPASLGIRAERTIYSAGDSSHPH